MNRNTILGSGLLLAGVALLAFALVSIYLVFTKSSKIPYFFELPGISIDLSNVVGSDIPQDQVAQLRGTKNLKTDLVSADTINLPLNFIAYMLFMGFFANIGFKTASLGVQFLRPIKVNLREEVLPTKESAPSKTGGDKNG